MLIPTPRLRKFHNKTIVANLAALFPDSKSVSLVKHKIMQERTARIVGVNKGYTERCVVVLDLAYGIPMVL